MKAQFSVVLIYWVAELICSLYGIIAMLFGGSNLEL